MNSTDKASDWDCFSLANHPQFLTLIEESRRSYRQHGGIGLEEVRQELGLPTKSRRQSAKKRKGKRGYQGADGKGVT